MCQYTSGYYFFAVFLVMLSLFLMKQPGSVRTQVVTAVVGSFLLACSMGIYQGYLGLACCFYAIDILFYILFDDEQTNLVMRRMVRFAGTLLGGVIIYFLINKAFLLMLNLQMNQLHVTSELENVKIREIVRNMRICYKGVYSVLFEDFYGINNIAIFRFAFALGLFFMMYVCVKGIIRKIRQHSFMQALMIIGIILIYPLGMNCIFMLTGEKGVHTLMMYPVVTVFIFPLLYCSAKREIRNLKEDACAIHKRICLFFLIFVLFLTSGSNILLANKAYRKLGMANTYARLYLTTLITQIKSLEGYCADMPILFIGSLLDREDETFSGYEAGWADVRNMEGVYDAHLMTNAAFLEYYCGFVYDSPDNREEIKNSYEVKKMPCYPNYGSIIIYDNIVIVKLS